MSDRVKTAAMRCSICREVVADCECGAIAIGKAHQRMVRAAAACTGLSASWCPVHGDCTCPDRADRWLPCQGPDLPHHQPEEVVMNHPHAPKTKRSGIELIAAERMRQMTDEGWTPEHDDEHDAGEIAFAAMSYACPPGVEVRSSGTAWGGSPPRTWPWDARAWKPCPDDRVRELTKAGALIAAEIDRLLAKRGAE